MRKFWFAAAISLPVIALSYPDLFGLDRWAAFGKGSDSLPGEYGFECGMGMLHGKLIVR